jgi:hypothetical protein
MVRRECHVPVQWWIGTVDQCWHMPSIFKTVNEVTIRVMLRLMSQKRRRTSSKGVLRFRNCNDELSTAPTVREVLGFSEL